MQQVTHSASLGLLFLIRKRGVRTAPTRGKGNGTCKGPEVELCPTVQRKIEEVSSSGVTEGESGRRGDRAVTGADHAGPLAFILNEVGAREDSKLRRDMT